MLLKTNELFIFKFDSIVLALSSTLFGFMLFTFTNILRDYQVYTLIRNIFDNRIIGAAFMFLGVSKMLGIVFNWRIVKILAIRGLLFLWMLFLIAFAVTPPPNTIWVLAFTMVILATGATIKEKER